VIIAIPQGVLSDDMINNIVDNYNGVQYGAVCPTTSTTTTQLP